MSTRGGADLQLLGVDLGASQGEYIASVDIDGTPCQNLTWFSDFVLRCTSAASLGGQGIVNVNSIWGQTFDSAPGIIAYEMPELSPTNPVEVDPPAIFNVLTESYVVRAFGKNFGFPRQGGNGTETRMQVSGKDCENVTVVNDGEIVCHGISPPWTIGDYSVRVILRGGRTAVALNAFIFQPPVRVVSAQPAIISGGGGQITIGGTGLGASALDVQSVRVGPHPCGNVRVEEGGTRITCDVPPGVGADHRVVVESTRNGLNDPAEAPTVSYRAPSVTKLSVVATSANVGEAEPVAAGVPAINGSNSNATIAGTPRAASYLHETLV